MIIFLIYYKLNNFNNNIMSENLKRSKELGLLFVVGGPGGSGASTISKMLAKHFSLKYVYAGQFMRDLAKDQGFKSLTEFIESDLLKRNFFEFDQMIDRRLIEASSEKNVLIDSKIFAALSIKRNIPCTVKIWLEADLDVRVSRTLGKKGFQDLSERNPRYASVRENLQKRLKEDSERFFKLYGIDIEKQSDYNDIIINSSEQNAKETFEYVLELIEVGGYI
jgi:predicted cytidylate kinase